MASGLIVNPSSVAVQPGGEPDVPIVVNPPAVTVQGSGTSDTDVLTLPVVGPRGPQGLPGLNGAGYVHTQSEASASWVIEHNMDIYPIVSVQVDGEQVLADVEYPSSNVVSITFATPQTGMARFA